MTPPQHRPAIRAVSFEDVGSAIGRLFEIAKFRTHQGKRVADFLLAWWDGDQWGHFPILHLSNCDAIIAEDMLIIMANLSKGEVTYAYDWGYREEMEALIDQWRTDALTEDNDD
ncbi:MAG: hypothetical protein OSB00_09450 [Sphingomonas bacterium]|nr:hypothetical protein [Sphingomonas bacterium]